MSRLLTLNLDLSGGGHAALSPLGGFCCNENETSCDKYPLALQASGLVRAPAWKPASITWEP